MTLGGSIALNLGHDLEATTKGPFLEENKALSISTLRKKLFFVEFCCENFWTLMAS